MVGVEGLEPSKATGFKPACCTNSHSPHSDRRFFLTRKIETMCYFPPFSRRSTSSHAFARSCLSNCNFSAWVSILIRANCSAVVRAANRIGSFSRRDSIASLTSRSISSTSTFCVILDSKRILGSHRDSMHMKKIRIHKASRQRREALCQTLTFREEMQVPHIPNSTRGTVRLLMTQLDLASNYI